MEKRICTKCKIEKDVNEYYIDRASKSGLCTRCKSCHKEYQKQRRQKEETKEKIKKFIENHPDYKKQWRKDNQEAIKEYRKKWNAEHRVNCNISTQKYKAQKSKLPDTLTKEQWDQCKQRFNNKCAYCGQELPLSQEHFIPLSKGGEYTHNNIVPACKSCNSSKHNNYFEEWYPKYEYYDKQREQTVLKYLRYEDKTQQLTMIAN